MTQTEFMFALASFDPRTSIAFREVERKGVQTREILLGARITIEGTIYRQCRSVDDDLGRAYSLLFLSVSKTLEELGYAVEAEA